MSAGIRSHGEIITQASTSFISAESSFGIAFAPPPARRRSPSPDLEIRHTSPVNWRKRGATESTSDSSSAMTSEDANISGMESQEKPWEMGELENRDFEQFCSVQECDDVQRAHVVSGSAKVMDAEEEAKNSGRRRLMKTEIAENSVGVGQSGEKKTAVGEVQPTLADKNEIFVAEAPVPLIHIKASEMISIVESGIFDEDRANKYPSPTEIIADEMLREDQKPSKEGVNTSKENRVENKRNGESKNDDVGERWSSVVELIDEC
ncbi:hypothetical protein Tcan_04460 [Toxocara canis]|uniref:Uncharacterized protein n=1 Tax=Toxocara canis TaxID=6265 RepID=A0A0B2VD54_TOXCA|nr:hypothetical protein Tcan_04460 [Toxocara canis]